MTTEQQEFIKKDQQAKNRAMGKPGKFTRLGAGQYYFYSGEGVLYYLCKRTALGAVGRGWYEEWSWAVDGQSPNDYFSSYSEAKRALLEYVSGI